MARRKKLNKRYDNELKFNDMFPLRDDGLCRCGCGRELTGRKTSWYSRRCSNKAFKEYSIRKGWSSAIRAAVFRRDHGVCAICKKDCSEDGSNKNGRCRGGGTQWQADHIVAIADGGKNEIDNIQTLCLEHHHKKTQELMKRLRSCKKS